MTTIPEQGLAKPRRKKHDLCFYCAEKHKTDECTKRAKRESRRDFKASDTGDGRGTTI